MVRSITSKDEFDKLLLSEGCLIVVDFTASWCPPCRRIAPFLEALSTQYTDVRFVKVDVDEVSDLASACEIKAMPTFQLYKNGQKVYEFSGADEEKLKMSVERFK